MDCGFYVYYGIILSWQVGMLIENISYIFCVDHHQRIASDRPVAGFLLSFLHRFILVSYLFSFSVFAYQSIINAYGFLHLKTVFVQSM